MRILILALLAAMAGPALASGGGDCRGNSCNSGGGGGDVTSGDVTSDVDVVTDVENTITNNVTGGSTSIVGGDTSMENKTKTFAFSHSLGGVSIEDCLASTQWGTILFSKQKVVLNKWCAAEVYDSKGLHKMAALTRCDIEEISKFFASQEECVAANIIHPVITVEAYKEQSAEIESLMSKVAEIEAELAKPPPPPPRRTVVQQEYLSDKKRAALRAMLEE